MALVFVPRRRLQEQAKNLRNLLVEGKSLWTATSPQEWDDLASIELNLKQVRRFLLAQPFPFIICHEEVAKEYGWYLGE